MKKILVIEDTAKHREDATEFFANIEGVEITYKVDGWFGSPFGHLTEFDGVISDIFFPFGGEGDEPIGVGVMMLCDKLKIPCILNTAGYHHGPRYGWINCLLQVAQLPNMVDASHDKFKEAETKNWAKAWEELSKLFP